MQSASPQEHTPVAIVGGGPAGLAAAIAQAQAGVSVVVLERGSWPRDKVCGEGVMPTGVAVLDRLGVLPLIAPAQCRPFRGIDWLNVAGAGVGGDFAQGAGLAIRRTGLSDALVRRAKQLDGIALWARACVQDVRLQPDGMVLSITQGGASRTLRAQVVVAADGRHSPIRKRFGLDGPPSVSMQRWGARQHFEIVDT